MDSEEVCQGVAKKQDDGFTVMVDNQGKEKRWLNDDIELVKTNTVSIMPKRIQVLSRREIRDLVACLSSLRD